MEIQDARVCKESNIADLDNTLLGNDTNVELPPKPEEPSQSDCCGSGCSPCIFDIYETQLKAWKLECLNLRQNQEPTATEKSRTCYQEIVCTSVTHHTTDVLMFTFQMTTDTTVLKFKPGEYIVLKNGDDLSLSRAFTPLPSDSLGSFKIIVKLYPNGSMSRFLSKICEGNTVCWKGPYSSGFNYRRNSFKHIVMFCAGTGVAPAYALCCAITADELDETFLHLVVSYRYESDFLLRDELYKLADSWNFTYKVFLTKESDITTWYRENVMFQRINKEVVWAELCDPPKDRLLVLICGTKSFNKDIANYVKVCGIEQMYIL